MAEYGIDFGTRNTAVSCNSSRFASDSKPIPSAVAYDRYSNSRRFGQAALDVLSLPPTERSRWRVARSFKTALESDEAAFEGHEGNKTAAEVLEDFLSLLLDAIRKSKLPPIDSAILSIPVGFPSKSRMRIVSAAEAHGIKVRGLVSESTAAYIKEKGSGHHDRIAVIDWGAGTLDISIIRATGQGGPGTVFEELACVGSTVAGDAIDEAIYSHLAAEARSGGRAVPRLEEIPVHVRTAIFTEIERQKIQLSNRGRNRASTNLVFPEFGDGQAASFTLTVDQMARVLQPIFAQVFAAIDRALANAQLDHRQIDAFLFVGGCVSVLGFREAAEARYPSPMFPPNPDWVVAEGALRLHSSGGEYESLQEFGLVLDDRSFLPLHQLRAFGKQPERIRVAPTEASDTASLVIAERQGNRQTTIGGLSVPLQGHVGEPVRVLTELRKDLTVGIEAWSECCLREKDARRFEYSQTRFRFRL